MSCFPKAIEAVRAISSDLVVLPGSQQYNEVLGSYFTELERDLRPSAFLLPRTATQVSEIVKILKPFGDGLRIAISGAGQQSTPGVANTQNGITIHLRNLQGIRLDADNGVVSVAAGEQMGKVYDTVGAQGLAVVGNRHSSAGIGGDAVQGGLSYFSYARGFVCDNVVSYEIVLANGEIVHANAETNKDLWISLKGGGNNFGIVTRFDLAVFEQGQLWGGKVFYFPPSFPSQIQSLVAYLKDPTADTNVHICLSLGYAPAMGDVLCMNDIFCTQAEKPKALEPFADVQPQIEQMKSLRIGSLKDFTDEAFGSPVSNRVIKMSTTVKADAGILEYVVSIFHSSLESLRGLENLLFSLSFEPLPVSLIEQAAAKGGNATGLKASDGPLVIILLYTSWTNANDDKNVIEINKKALEAIDEKARSRNVAATYRYLNYAFPNQDVVGSYGPESKAHLQAASKKYDPEGFWQTAGVGPFKVSI
ncbi:hypothetical protein BD289DRAFT_460456 [Coniella lustricola]|uniref:FAD-binding PCMH-type domain-containing protein n=1 Tax=Coniella lustricola TaxID=2025994 RepID=A0A2T3A9Z3_9PEZI|nr:hypothetical protein BD289DRAFT_460456 [Coniella lustricola]